MFELNIPAAVLAAMGLGVALSMSLRAQMRMQRDKNGSVPATPWFTRITQACLSFQLLAECVIEAGISCSYCFLVLKASATHCVLNEDPGCIWYAVVGSVVHGCGRVLNA